MKKLTNISIKTKFLMFTTLFNCLSFASESVISTQIPQELQLLEAKVRNELMNPNRDKNSLKGVFLIVTKFNNEGELTVSNYACANEQEAFDFLVANGTSVIRYAISGAQKTLKIFVEDSTGFSIAYLSSIENLLS